MIETITKHAHQPAERHQLDARKLKINTGALIVAEAPTPDELDALAEKFLLDRGNLNDTSTSTKRRAWITARPMTIYISDFRTPIKTAAQRLGHC